MPSNTICPFCVWSACGLLLWLCAPELIAVSTPVGVAGVWLMLIPAASALLLRLRGIARWANST